MPIFNFHLNKDLIISRHKERLYQEIDGVHRIGRLKKLYSTL